MLKPPSILRLSEAVYSKIAAGEVIQSPFNVVKELVENSLDAGASEVRVRLREGGMRLIEVADNGHGIAFEELPVAVERHATSKIKAVTDLEKLATLGFRGEALPSVAAVSRFTLCSAPAGATGGRLVLAGEQQIAYEETGHPQGTTITAEDLFFNLPARRKFLRAPAYEFGRIHQLIKRFALAYPEVAWTLTHNDKPVANFPRVQAHLARVTAVLGNSGAAQESGWQTPIHEYVDSGDNRELKLFYPPTRQSFANSRQQFFFLNRRLIQDRSLGFALGEGFRSFVMQGRYPGAVMLLQVPAERFDVNVHPTKEEVRFADSQEMVSWVKLAVRQALGSPVRPVAVVKPSYEVAQGGWDFLQQPQPIYNPKPVAAAPEPQMVLNPTPGFSQLRLIGQFRASYLVCEDGDRLILIDQHAAHERILFEEWVERFAAGPLPSQTLLEPILVTVNAAELQAAESHRPLLVDIGFEFEPFGEQDLLLRRVPVSFKGSPKQIFKEMLADLHHQGIASQFENLKHRLLATLACHSAIRFNHRLDFVEMQELLKQLDKTRGSSNCPHGRPVMTCIEAAQLEKLFRRI